MKQITIRDAIKQTMAYAKPVQWKIFGFNLSFFFTIIAMLGANFAMLPIISYYKGDQYAAKFLVVIVPIGFILAIFYVSSIFNTIQAKIKFIIEYKNGLNPSFKSLWKNSLKFNCRTLKFGLWFWLFSIGLGMAIGIIPLLIMIPQFDHANSQNNLPLSVTLIIALIQVIEMSILIPIFYLGLINLTLTKVTALKSIINGYKICFKRFAKIVILSACAYIIIVAPADLLQQLNQQTMPILSMVIFVLCILMIVIYIFMESYYLSYCLVHFFDEIEVNKSTTEDATQINN